jgi:hypothetical protein
MDKVWGWRRGSCGSIDHVGGEECGRKEDPRKIKHHAGWGPQDIVKFKEAVGLLHIIMKFCTFTTS